jgi:pantoate--beta-alanine ligase
MTLPARCSVGFVPTAGNLHEGHLSLVRAALAYNDVVVVSIFDTRAPDQTGGELDDPSGLTEDVRRLEQEGVAAVFAPSWTNLCANNSSTIVDEHLVSFSLCDAGRSECASSQATVMVKLFNLVQPKRIYLGQKNVQQCALVRRVVRDLHIPVQVVVCPTAREKDGLAIGSCNRHLSGQERAAAALVYDSLRSVRAIFDGGERDVAQLLALGRATLSGCEHIAIRTYGILDADSLQPMMQIDGPAIAAVSAHIGATVLADNVPLGGEETSN